MKRLGYLGLMLVSCVGVAVPGVVGLSRLPGLWGVLLGLAAIFLAVQAYASSRPLRDIWTALPFAMCSIALEWAVIPFASWWALLVWIGAWIPAMLGSVAGRLALAQLSWLLEGGR